MSLIKRVFPRSVRGKLMDWMAFLPDEPYIRLFHFAATGHILHLKEPKLFSEKQQWLKLHDIHPEYSELVDKLSVRKHIDECLGKGHCFPLLGSWDSFDSIEFDDLPNQFVLKCNHDSGSTKVIRDKAALSDRDMQALKNHFDERLKRDFFYAGREYPYKGIRPCILAEQLMLDSKHVGKDIEDYKFFCFNGVPRIMFVATDRSTDCRFDFFDMDFNWLNVQNIHPNADHEVEKPKHFAELKQAAAKLSQGMRFVRVDLYEIDDVIYFGEYTFFHGGGFNLFYPLEWERKLGDWIDLEE